MLAGNSDHPVDSCKQHLVYFGQSRENATMHSSATAVNSELKYNHLIAASDDHSGNCSHSYTGQPMGLLRHDSITFYLNIYLFAFFYMCLSILLIMNYLLYIICYGCFVCARNLETSRTKTRSACLVRRYGEAPGILLSEIFILKYL